MEKSHFFSYAGFHFKLCSVELRELFAYIFELPTFVESIHKHLPNVQEFVPLHTCNRFDICFFGVVEREKVSALFFELALKAIQSRFTHLNVEEKTLKIHIFNSLRFAVDREGLHLFFQVASSLDSLVLGETQILGQLKTAYQQARKKGYANKIAAPIFDHCFKIAKRIRTETDLFKNVVSIAHLAVAFAQKEFSDMANKNIVIFGAGEMALLTAKHFAHHGAKKIFIANRTFKNAEWLCQKIGLGVPIELSYALQTINHFDICVTACAGDDVLITAGHFAELSCHEALFIDISVPRKIESSIALLPKIKLINIDQLTTIVEQNKAFRKDAIQNAEKIIYSEVNQFFLKQQKREDLSRMRHFNVWLKDVVQKEVDRFLRVHQTQKVSVKKPKSTIIARTVCKKVSSKMRDEKIL